MVFDELVPWLREQIAAERDRDGRVQRRAPQLYQAWQPNNPYAWDEQADDVRDEYLHAAELLVDQEMPAVLAQCAAYEAILDRAEQLGPGTDSHRGLRYAVQAVGLAHQHLPGYRQEWRP